MRTTLIILGVVALVLAVFFVARPKQAPVGEERKYEVSDVFTQKYTDPKLGFSFKYPAGWGTSDSSQNQLSILVTEFGKAPETLGPNDLATGFTKTDLDKLQSDLKNGRLGTGEKMVTANGNTVFISSEYDVPSGQFLTKAKFFAGKDLVEIWTTLPVSGAPFSWPSDRAQVDAVQKQLQAGEVGPDVKKVQDTFESIVKTITLSETILSAECTAQPTILENGRKSYPIDEQYEHLPWLGQLFTADDCGAERVELIAPDGYYARGSKVWAKGAPSVGLREALTSAGYHCDAGVSDELCSVWRIDTPALVSKFLKLKTFSTEIESDDCINCG